MFRLATASPMRRSWKRPAGFVVTIAVSLFDRKPDAYTRALVDYIRHP